MPSFPAGLLTQRQKQLETDNRENPGLNIAGQLSETTAEFLAGDEALKGMALSGRLLKTAKIAQMLEDSPRLAKVVDLGISALRAGGVQGGISYLKSGGNAGQAAGQGALAAGATGLLGAAGEGIGALRKALSAESLQKPLQDAITNAVRSTAAEHGIPLDAATNVRDIAQSLSDGLRSKAHGIYSSLDDALSNVMGSPTRIQAFDDQIDNITKSLRDNIGLDPAQDARLQQRLQSATNDREAAHALLRENGVDVDGQLQQANGLHQRSMALQDVAKGIRASVDGHPSLASNGQPTPANVKIAQVFKRMQALDTPNPRYPGTPSRLVQAIGEDRARELVNTVDNAYLGAQKMMARNAALKTAAKTIGLGTLGYEGLHLVHGLFGDGK